MKNSCMNTRASQNATSFRCRCVSIALAGCLLTAVFASTAAAQSAAPRITAETVVRYLQKDLFISPGVGFQKVRIGNTFEQVARVWGLPNKKLESSEAGSQVIWVYNIDSDSEIALAGSSKVSTIRVLGSFNSPFSSREGAHFGMTPHQVISIYGAPADAGNLTRLRYPKKGIAFAFEQGALRAMQVKPPAP